ncbi:MAG: DUF4091 domain-containing protein [Clostridia bacterium]|nr:DUF4091 domain-containing protein [Clostridia bacterium]
MIKLHTRIVSSLEKGFLDQWPEQFSALHRATMLSNQHLSFQLFYRLEADNHARRCTLELEGEIAPYATVYSVEQVPVLMPSYLGKFDDNYLRTEPGLYPDLLQPLHYGNALFTVREQMRSAWISISTQGALAAGCYPLTLVIRTVDGEEQAREQLEIEILPAELPKHGLILTQWFHCDCLANYYNVEVFSERHWEIIENFMRTAAEYGQNMILTPIITPPLDTAVGGERRTTQLVGITLENGHYSFDFSLLDRFMDMALRVGIEYFEMAHLFTQWGAAHAPKVIATVDGKEQRIFGWETDAAGEEYTAFLRALLPALVAHLKERGLDKRCKYHISDEPNGDSLEQYRRAQAVVQEALEGYDIMDALSSIEFYKQGVTKMPIPCNDHVHTFLDENIEGLWTYYCCVQHTDVSNRFIAMPSWRTRALGMQCFKYNIAGFLHWGFNFYSNMYSSDSICPFLCNDGDMQVPAGDAFVVYPGQDGRAMESLRLVVIREALEDIAAMKLAASLCGKQRVIEAMERVTGNIRFDRCPHSAAEMLAVREAVDALIKENV